MAFNQLQQLPGTLVRTSLRVARFPLDAAESVLRRGQRDGEWEPTIAYEGVEATVKRLAGSVLRDDKLVEEGRLQQAKVEKLRKAATLESQARAKERQADEEFRQRRQADEERRRQVARQADQQEDALARQRAAREKAAAEEQRRKEAAARKVEAASKKAVATKARKARATRVAAESEALAAKRDAVEAKAEVAALDAAIETTKAVRQANS